MPVTAYVDESEPGDRRDPGAYILGAVLVTDDAAEDFRTSLRGLKPTGASKLHWTESDHRHRLRVAEELANHVWRGIVVVGLHQGTTRSERRRRLTLERLLVELAAVGVHTAVLESRGPADRSDRAHVDALRAQRAVLGVRIDHRPGASEPLLWAADALCGAIGRDRRGEPQYLDVVRARVDVVEHPR